MTLDHLDQDLTGRTALVTGATAGIGRGIALTLGALGARVLVHGRDPERGAAVVAAIEERGGSARFLGADLADADQVLALAAAAEDAGPVDVLVNSAGVYDFTPTAATDAAAFDRQLAINTRAPFLLVGALAPRMVERGAGVVVNVSSTAATSPAPVGAAYGASKAAVELLTRSWATEYGAAGVRVNAVSPGPVRTDGTVAMLGEHVESMGRGNLRGVVGEPEEIAAVVAFLAGPASSYVNGSVFVADGGALSTMPA